MSAIVDPVWLSRAALADETAHRIDDHVRGRILEKDLGDPQLLQRDYVLVGDHAASEEDDVVDASLLEPLHDPREGGHVSAREEADAEHVDVFLHGGVHHFFRSAVQPGVDHVHARVSQAAGDDPDAAIVAVQADFCHQHANILGHYCLRARGRTARSIGVRISYAVCALDMSVRTFQAVRYHWARGSNSR